MSLRWIIFCLALFALVMLCVGETVWIYWWRYLRCRAYDGEILARFGQMRG